MVINPEDLQQWIATYAPNPTPSVGPVPTFTPQPILEEFQAASEVGRRTLWVVFVIMVISSLAFYLMAYRVPTSKRLFHVITAFITTFAAISYYSMAVGDGVYNNVIKVKDSNAHVPDTFYLQSREVYWARYVDWSVTTPLLLLDLAVLAGLSGANITVAIVADVIMILTGLFAGLVKEESKSWGYYAIACIAYLVVVYQLAFNGRNAVSQKDSNTATFFTSIAGFTLLLWTAYPIIWGVADGARILNVDGEIIGYAVLDVLAKPVFGFWLLFTHDAMASSSISVNGFWTHGLNSEGNIRVGDDDEGA